MSIRLLYIVGYSEQYDFYENRNVDRPSFPIS